MNVMRGIEEWRGPSALVFFLSSEPGALPRAGMASGLWPSEPRAGMSGRRPSDFSAPKARLMIAWGIAPGAQAARLEAVRGLLPAFEAKIARTLARVWGTAPGA